MKSDRIKILVHARKEGFKLHRVNEWNYVLKRVTKEKGSEVVNVYWNKSNRFFTVLTAIDHPKRGKDQLTRKFLDANDVNQLITNPRTHTGKGYYKKH
jgi:hypothetical protein